VIWETKASKVDKLLRKYAPEVAAAFSASIADLGRRVDVKKLEKALTAGDLTAALNAFNLDSTAFVVFEEAFRQAFIGSGLAFVATTPDATGPNGDKIVLRFNGRDQAAEQWLRQHSGTMVRDVVADTRNALRAVMADGLARGVNPKTLVPALAGRSNPSNRVRTGGILGLTSEQAQYAENMLAELLSGDASKLDDYLGRKLRDKTLDTKVAGYLRSNTPVPAALAERAVAAYRSKLAAHRAKTVGLTETLTAMSKSEFTAFEQAVASGQVEESSVEKFWEDANDRKVRHTHSILGDGKGIPFRQPFISASGARLMHPHDRSLGAPASEIIGCRCRVRYRIDFFAGVK
jgi:hypothetical protein